MSDSAPVSVVVADGVATVTIDNPPINALDERCLEELGAVAGRLAADAGVRAVVLTGAGEKAFAAGADLRELAEALGDREEMARHVGITRPVFDAWSSLPVPVIAAAGASAVGGGLELALTCDVIVAAPTARFGCPEVKLGLIPGAGGTQRLPRRIGTPAATRLLMLGTTVDADEALRLGLVDIVAADDTALAQATALAERVAALPGQAVRAAKGAARAALERPLAQGLDAERELFLAVALTDDAREGAAAFLERRPGRFSHS